MEDPLIARCSLGQADPVGPGQFGLAFGAQQRDESSSATRAQKRTEEQHDRHRDSRHDCQSGGTGSASGAAPGQGEEGSQPEAGRAAAAETPAGRRTKAAPKRASKAGTKAARAKPVISPRPESKGSQILALIGRSQGATLGEIRKTTGWQAHSVRGFLSTAAKKHSLQIESSKTEAGDRVYRIQK